MKVLLSAILLVMAVSRSQCFQLHELNLTIYSWLNSLLKSEGGEASRFLKELKVLTKSNKDLIIKIHNDLRELIASGQELRGSQGKGFPPAQNMQEMVWDNYIAKQADSLAKTCTFKHEKHYDQDFHVLGQNIAMDQTSEVITLDDFIEKSLEQMLRRWYDEIDLMDFVTGGNEGTTSFTQMIWADSRKIGCGIALCECGFDLVLFVVCDYAPSGNIGGRNPYLKGYENCHAFNLNGPTETYPHLCANHCSLKFSQQTSINNLIIYAISVYLYWL